MCVVNKKLNSFSFDYMIYFLHIFNLAIWICRIFYCFNDPLEISRRRGHTVLCLRPCTWACVHHNCASSMNHSPKSHGRGDNEIDQRKRLETENLKFSKINTIDRIIVTNVILIIFFCFCFSSPFYGLS